MNGCTDPVRSSKCQRSLTSGEKITNKIIVQLHIAPTRFTIKVKTIEEEKRTSSYRNNNTLGSG